MDSELFRNTPGNDYGRPCENDGCQEGYIYSVDEYDQHCKEKCSFCEDGIIND